MVPRQDNILNFRVLLSGMYKLRIKDIDVILGSKLRS